MILHFYLFTFFLISFLFGVFCWGHWFGLVSGRFWRYRPTFLPKVYFSNELLPPEGDVSAQLYVFNELLPPEGDFSAQIYFFNELLPPEGDFSAQIYFFYDLLPPEGD